MRLLAVVSAPVGLGFGLVAIAIYYTILLGFGLIAIPIYYNGPLGFALVSGWFHPGSFVAYYWYRRKSVPYYLKEYTDVAGPCAAVPALRPLTCRGGIQRMRESPARRPLASKQGSNLATCINICTKICGRSKRGRLKCGRDEAMTSLHLASSKCLVC